MRPPELKRADKTIFMKTLTSVLLVSLIAILFVPAKVSADGMFVVRKFVWDKHKDINEPTQKAILVYDAGREDLILQVKYEGPVDEFGWLIPVPNLPTVQNGSMKCFYELSQYTQRRFERWHYRSIGLFANAPSAQKIGQREPPVKVVEIKTVGAYKVAVLSTKDSDALEKWLDTNHFYFPTNKSEVIDFYVKQHWYFVAVKINLGKSFSGLPSTSSDLASGELNPLQISFASDRCVFPLKISSVNDKPSEVQVYVLSPERLLEKTMLEKEWGGLVNALPYAKVTKTDLPDCSKFIPRLRFKSWWLTKQTCTFKPEEMRDLEFEPALSTNPAVQANPAWIFNRGDKISPTASAANITSVAFSGSSENYTITINGTGFGSLPGSVPFNGVTPYFRLFEVAQLGAGEWGYPGDAKTLTYQSWSDVQIQISGLAAQTGDAIQIWVSNPTTGSSATWGGNVPGGSDIPQITSVNFSGNGANLQVQINGFGFGNAPAAMPFTGDLNQFLFADQRTHSGAGSFNAGAGLWGIRSPTPVTVKFQSWSDNQIIIGGFAGSYGQNDANTLQNGDSVYVVVWNGSDTSQTGPQTAWGGFVSANPTSVTENQPGLSPDLQEVVALSKQHMNDKAIASYIKNSGKTFKLNAEDMIYLLEQGISENVIRALMQTTSVAIPTMPDGTGGQIRILSGTGDFASVSDANNTLNASPGAALNGTIELSVLNLGPGGAVAPLIYTPSWGDHSSSWRSVSGSVPPGQSQQQAQVSLVVPTTPGVYHIIFAAGWELTGDQVASATDWPKGYNVWNDGNDIAEFTTAQLSSAQLNGWAFDNFMNETPPYYYRRPIPADAITLIVTGNSSPPSTQNGLSPDLQEVVKLFQAHMGDDIITSYIKSNGKSYKLSADDIIYLNNQGVSKSVISALLHTAIAPTIETPPVNSNPPPR